MSIISLFSFIVSLLFVMPGSFSSCYLNGGVSYIRLTDSHPQWSLLSHDSYVIEVCIRNKVKNQFIMCLHEFLQRRIPVSIDESSLFFVAWVTVPKTELTRPNGSARCAYNMMKDLGLKVQRSEIDYIAKCFDAVQRKLKPGSPKIPVIDVTVCQTEVAYKCLRTSQDLAEHEVDARRYSSDISDIARYSNASSSSSDRAPYSSASSSSSDTGGSNPSSSSDIARYYSNASGSSTTNEKNCCPYTNRRSSFGSESDSVRYSNASSSESESGGLAGYSSVADTRIFRKVEYLWNCYKNAKQALCNVVYVDAADKNVCAICLKELLDGEEVARTTACSHEFHHACITTWIVKKWNCPLCRTSVNS